MRILGFAVGLLFLITIEILRVYFIMPFPGSQEDEAIWIAYWLHQNILYLRIIGILVIFYPTFLIIKNSSQVVRITISVLLAFYVVVFYAFNYKFLADKMFLQTEHVAFLSPADNKVDESQLVIGIESDSESKAYPIEVIGYHHQVRDNLNGSPIMVTYCTVCRTGRVYSPVVNNKEEKFRLVGMDHYNAMFEDKTTGSWWRQVSGEAIVGPLAGSKLNELTSEQMTLTAWINLHPNTLIMQPDTLFNAAYEGLKDYDEGKMTGRLESKDSLSWKDKSWVVGVTLNFKSRAYDWIELQNKRILQDTLSGTPLVVLIEPDSASFHVFNRQVKDQVLSFTINNDTLTDSDTKSKWDWRGHCLSGPLSGTNLNIVQAYQEYWHSWSMFRGKDAYRK